MLISVTVPDLGTDLIAMGQRIEALKSTFQSIGLWTQSVDDTLLLSIFLLTWKIFSITLIECNVHSIFTHRTEAETYGKNIFPD